MEQQELDKYRNKVWLSITDVKTICSIGYDKAKQIVNGINDEREGKYYIPDRNKVPSNVLFNKLGL